MTSKPNDTPPHAVSAVATSTAVGSPWSLTAGDWADGTQLCAQADPDLWYPEFGTEHAGFTNPTAQANAAAQICRRCPLMRPCLTWALSTGEVWGVWGGMPSKVRQVARRGIGGDPARLEAVVDAEVERALNTPADVKRVHRNLDDEDESAA